MTQGPARCLSLLLGCLVLPACARTPQTPLPTATAETAMTAADKDVVHSRTVGGYTYTDAPVEARLGPHGYRIPANYFRDQIGPDFQGNFSLLVQWPDLQPLPPGERAGQDMETFAKQVTISPDYVDRVPMEGLLEKSIRQYGSEGTLAHDNPSERLELRDEQPAFHGLTPYWANGEKYAAYLKLQEQAFGYPSAAELQDREDWYLDRDDQGRLTTVIKCDSHLQPDGFIVEGDRLTREGNRSTSCIHYFLMPDDKISFSLAYARVFLKDWRRIQGRAQELLTRYRIR